MGNAVAKAKQAAADAVNASEAKAKEDARQAQADIANLQELLESRADQYYLKLINGKGEDKTVPIKTIIDYKKHLSVSVSQGPSKELDAAVQEMFGGNFLGSLKALCLVAINSVLGNSSAGAKVEEGYKLLILHSAVVRVDYFVYGYNVVTSGLTERKQNGLAFVCTVGVVDMTKIGLEALVYLVGVQAAEATSFIQARKEMWEGRKAKLNVANYDTDGKSTISTLVLMDWLKSVKEETIEKFELPNIGTAEPKDSAAPQPAENEGKKSWDEIKGLLINKIDELLVVYKDFGRIVAREQEEMLDRMEDVFGKARKVVANFQKVN